MTCKDCIHQESCINWTHVIKGDKHVVDDIRQQISEGEHYGCENFQSKDCFISLPCPIGNPIYEITGGGSIWERYVAGYHCNTKGKQKGAWLIVGTQCGMFIRVKLDRLGKSVFIREEDAKRARDKQFPDKAGEEFGTYACSSLGY